MRFLIIGCGSIGQRHMRNLRLLGHQACGCDPDPSRPAEFRRPEEALKQKFDGALICAPTRFHISLALAAARKGIHLFIEKPLSDSLAGLPALQKAVRQKKLVTLVGCNTRFFPSFELAKNLLDQGAIGRVLSVRISCGFYLPYWHPQEDYRIGYSAKRALGGGVILDDIHEIDSLYWLFGPAREVFCLADKVSDLAIDTEDIAEIMLKLKSGVIAQVHLDYLQRTYRRSYEFIGDKGVLLWDYITQTVELFSAPTNRKQVFQESINTDRQTMFLKEMEHFVDCIKGKERSMNDITSARSILAIALACRASARKGKVVRL